MDRCSDESKVRLLSDHSHKETCPPETSHVPARCSVLTLSSMVLLGFNIVLLITNITITLVFSNHNVTETVPHLTHESQKHIGDGHLIITEDHLKYEERPEYLPYEFPWNQEPSDALDYVWGDLLWAQNIKISPEELRQLGLNSTNRIKVEGGNYYWAHLGVYHTLHCLNNLRRIVHRDYYEKQIQESKYPKAFEYGHTDHCIDLIRQTLMCHPNMAIYTAEWSDETHTIPNLEIQVEATTSCVNWGAIDSWARDRALRPGWEKYAS